MNRHLIKEVLLANRKRKHKCSVSVAVRDVQIKTALRFLLTQERVAIYQNSNTTTMSLWGGGTLPLVDGKIS